VVVAEGCVGVEPVGSIDLTIRDEGCAERTAGVELNKTTTDDPSWWPSGD